MVNERRIGRWGAPGFACALLVSATSGQTAFAQTATRDLTAFSEPGVSFTVFLSLDTPPGTAVVAVEETPPTGWIVSDISDGGSWDAQAAKVKWGLFFDPSIPTGVTYTATPAGGVGEFCFDGVASFDGANQTIAGDTCLSVGVPTVSEWGLLTMALIMLATGSVALRRGVASASV